MSGALFLLVVGLFFIAVPLFVRGLIHVRGEDVFAGAAGVQWGLYAEGGERAAPKRNSRRDRLQKVAFRLRRGGMERVGGVAIRVEGHLHGRQVRLTAAQKYNPRRPLRLAARVEGDLHLHVDRADAAGRFVLREVFELVGQAGRAERVFADGQVRRHLSALFGEQGCRELVVSDGWVTAKLPDGAIDLVPNRLVKVLSRLAVLANALERVAWARRDVAVRATARLGSARTCPYCRDDCVEGEDLVACGGCQTVHHAECYGELRRCASMGCGARDMTALRGFEATGQEFRLDLTACEACGERDIGCTEGTCHGSEVQRRRHAWSRAQGRRAARAAQRRR